MSPRAALLAAPGGVAVAALAPALVSNSSFLKLITESQELVYSVLSYVLNVLIQSVVVLAPTLVPKWLVELAPRSVVSILGATLV